jgi:hypothetical protein
MIGNVDNQILLLEILALVFFYSIISIDSAIDYQIKETLYSLVRF